VKNRPNSQVYALVVGVTDVELCTLDMGLWLISPWLFPLPLYPAAEDLVTGTGTVVLLDGGYSF